MRQPWAWAIIHGGKDVENRSRNIAGRYRGPVAIHAGLAWDADAPKHLRPDPHVRGAIIGVADLVGVHDSDDCWAKDCRRVLALRGSDPAAFAALPTSPAGGLIGKVRLCSPWALPDCTHLTLANPRPLTQPIPWRGQLGLWRVPDELQERIKETL